MNATDTGPPIANLFIVGVPKCGTTAWVEYLRTHPDIFFPDSKEDCYFATDLPNFRFIHTEADYAKLFEGTGVELRFYDSKTHALGSPKLAVPVEV